MNICTKFEILHSQEWDECMDVGMDGQPKNNASGHWLSPKRSHNDVHVVMEIHREILNNDILRPELPLSPFNGNLCRVYTTSWVLKRELAAHSNQLELIQRGVSNKNVMHEKN